MNSALISSVRKARFNFVCERVIRVTEKSGGWGTPRKIGWVVRPASQNPYPIYDQNLRYSHPIYDLTKNSKPYL